MTEYRPSIIEYYSEQCNNRCGYCTTKEGSRSHGLHAHTLRVIDYQNMIDRGWRRSGKYCYKSIMDNTCCPLYTIRCAAKEFKLSKTQKKILRKINNFLVTGTVKKDKFIRKTEIAQPMEIHYLDNDIQKAEANLITMESSSVNSLNKMTDVQDGQSQGDAEPAKEPSTTNSTDSKVTHTPKSKCQKAKYLRIERKKQKLQKLGLSEEEIAKKLVEKKKYPVMKTVEDYINETSSKQRKHNLHISLVRSWPRSEELENTFDVSFDLYKRYQRFVHKDPPEKLTQHQFERFLIISPLQIQLILVSSPEFEKTYIESAALFAKYQKAIHHESDEDCDIITFTNFLVETPLEAEKGYGSYHQQYWLDNKLIAVGVIDILPRCVSSVYFYYDPDYAHLSLGTYSALREVEFTRKLSSRYPDLIYYYMGFYIHTCVKIKYKGNFKPAFLLCPEAYTWHPIEKCLPKIEATKYSRLDEDLHAVDVLSKISVSEVLILYNRIAMSLASYLKQKKIDEEEQEEIMEYARLVGKTCAKNMLLYRN